MARLAHSANARFAILAFPVYPQIHGDASGRLQQQLVALGGTEGWPTLDLLPFFRRAAEAGAAPLLLDSWHPSPAGHALAAEAIADWLEAEGLLSKNGSAARCRSVSEADTRKAPIEGSP